MKKQADHEFREVGRFSVDRGMRGSTTSPTVMAHVCLTFRGVEAERLGHFKLTLEQAAQLRDLIDKQLGICQRPGGDHG